MKRLKWSREKTAVGSLCVLFIGISYLTAQKAAVGKEDGVAVIRNPIKPVANQGPSKLTLEEELTIGLFEKESGFHFEDIGAIQSDSSGNIYVLDRRACQIKKFNGAGEPLKSFGRKGQGPGEFGPPNGMHIISDKEVLVSSLGRLSYFDLDGTFIRQKTAMFWGAPIPDSKGNLVAETNMPNGGPPKFVKELRAYDLSLNILSLIRRHEYVMPSDSDILSPFPAITFYAVQSDDSVVWGVTDRYILTVSDINGLVKRKILKDFRPLRISDADKKTILNQLAPEAQYDFPDNYPPFRAFHVDDEGRIFVRTYERDKNGNPLYDVFNKEGYFFAKVVLEGAPLAWRKGRLYSMAEDRDGFLQVKRYRARWE